MSTRLDPRLFPDIRYNGKTYTRFSLAADAPDETVYCPYPFLSVYRQAIEHDQAPNLLLLGEGSIGKTTNLRLLEADLLSQGTPTYLIECKNLNGDSDILTKVAAYPAGTVILIDAWDELDHRHKEAVTALMAKLYEITQTARFRLVLSSRFDPQEKKDFPDRSNPQEKKDTPAFPAIPFAKAEVKLFTEEQIKIIIEPQVSHLAPLLGNTMFMSLYLSLRGSGATDGLKDVHNQGQFLRYYFRKLAHIKGSTLSDKYVDKRLVHIGERIYLNIQSIPTPEPISDDPGYIPQAFNSIFTQEQDEDGNYTVKTTQIRYRAFCLGMYIHNELVKTWDVNTDKSVLNIQLWADDKEAMFFAGEVMNKTEADTAEKIYREIPYDNDIALDWKSDSTFKNRIAQSMTYVVTGTNNRQSITIARSIPVLWYYAFSDCISLESVDMPKVTRIGLGAFASCSNLSEITIPNVTKIGFGAFANCSNLSEISLPNVTHIDNGAFRGCYNLKVIHFESHTVQTWQAVEKEYGWDRETPNYVVRCSDGCWHKTDDPIEAWRSSNKDTLTSDDIPNIRTIPAHAFSDCDQLQVVNLPNVTEIGFWAFENCFNLTEVSMPNVTRIGFGAFDNCSNLTTIRLQSKTIKEWKSILKGIMWDYNTPNYTVYCSDGTITKDGTITYYDQQPRKDPHS